MKQTLLVVMDEPLYAAGGEFFSANPIMEFYGQLSRYFRVVLSAPTYEGPAKEGQARYAKLSAKIIPQKRPFYGSLPSFLKSLPVLLPWSLARVFQSMRKADIVMLRLPTPLDLFVHWYAKASKKPLIIHVSGDALVLTDQKGLKKLFVRVLIWWFERVRRYVTRTGLVFVNGKSLAQKLKSKTNTCVNFIPSVISEQDIWYREDTCQREPVTLLFVGRIVKEKGIFLLLEAAAQLKEKGFQAHLKVVGTGPQQSELLRMAREKNMQKEIEFLGALPFGSPLFSAYKDADIFVLPSFAEGFPKTILEAMAFGVPIVAAKVGGIPDVLLREDAGILIPTGSVEAIVEAIEELSGNQGLRRRIIKNAYGYIKNNTLGKQVSFLGDMMAAYAGGKKP